MQNRRSNTTYVVQSGSNSLLYCFDSGSASTV